MIEKILSFLDKHEIDYRLESNFCCGYIFYFLDGSVYPRRYMDSALEGDTENILAESVDNLINKALAYELKKDWRHRIESDTINNLFSEVDIYLNQNYKSYSAPL